MTTGDAHAKKRIEKKKKKGEPTEEIVLRHGPPSSPQAHVADHRNLHVYKDRATGGGVCAKSVFFVLAILIALVLAFSMSGFQGQTGGDVAKTDSSLEGRIIRGIHHRSRGYDEDDDDDLEHSEEVDEDDGDDENEEEEEEEDEDDDETEAESEDEDESDENAEEEEDVEDNTEDASDVEEESVERETAEEDVADEEKSEEDEVEVASEDEDEATVDTEEDDENGRDYEENEPDEEEPEISGKVKKRAWTFRKIEPYRTDGDERTKPKNAEDEEIVPRTKLRRDFAKHDEERSKMREVKLDVRKPRGDFGKPKKNGRGRQDDDERNLKAEEAESTGEAEGEGREGKAPKLDLQKFKKDFIGIRPTFGKTKKNAVSIEKDEDEGDDDEQDVEEEEEEKKTPKLDLKKLKKDFIDIRPTFGKPKKNAVSIEKDEDEGDDDERDVEDEETKSTDEEEEEEEKKTPKLDLKKLKKDFINVRPTFGKPKKDAVSIEKDEDEGDHDEQNVEDEEESKSTGEGEEEEEGKKAPKLDLKKLKKDFISVRPTLGKPKKNAVSIEKDEDEGDDDEQQVEDVTGEEQEEGEEEKKVPKLDLKKLKRDFISVKPGFGKLKKSVALVGKKEDADGGDDADELEEEEEEEESKEEDDVSEQKLTRTEVAIKFGVGIAIFVTAYVVLVRKWKTDKFDGSAKGEEPDVSKTNTLVPPPTLQEVERDIEDFEGEEYSDRDDARPHAPSSRQHYEELRARYARTLTPNSEEDASEEYEEEEYDDDEEIDSVEGEELSEEEDYDEELLEKLERRYGKRASVSSEDYDEEDDEEYERKRRG